MKRAYLKLPYRNGVSCILFQGEKFLLVQKPEWSDKYWKFPQGGMNEGESELEAAARELKEEIGSDKFKIHGLSVHTNQYDWDEKSIEIAKCRWRGQIQKFVVAEFLGDINEISIDKNELRDSKWVKISELKKHVHHDFPLFTGYWETIKKVLKEHKKLFESSFEAS